MTDFSRTFYWLYENYFYRIDFDIFPLNNDSKFKFFKLPSTSTLNENTDWYIDDLPDQIYTVGNNFNVLQDYVYEKTNTLDPQYNEILEIINNYNHDGKRKSKRRSKKLRSKKLRSKKLRSKKLRSKRRSKKLRSKK
jgi:hypothetical protein